MRQVWVIRKKTAKKPTYWAGQNGTKSDFTTNISRAQRYLTDSTAAVAVRGLSLKNVEIVRIK